MARLTAEIIAAQLRAREVRAQATQAQRVVEETHQAAEEGEGYLNLLLMEDHPPPCISVCRAMVKQQRRFKSGQGSLDLDTRDGCIDLYSTVHLQPVIT